MYEQNTKNLLKVVQSKIDLYEKHKELSGENFNIFSIMGMESDEVFTHSAIIGELLSPKGSHGLGAKPLELFITQFLDDNFQFDCINAKCIKEQYIGIINENKTEGGRLDIVVQNTLGQIFVIENKIYAFEQENQLLRYKNKYPSAKIFYLTLDGSDSKQITNNENTDNTFYTTISYKNDILNWLENCIPLAYNKPMVREVLNQYIYLIKKLTNQTTNEEMSQEIINLIEKDFESATEIYNNFEKVLESKQNNFLLEIKDILQNKVKDENLITKIEIEKTINENRLKIYLTKGFFISFHFKNKNQPLILIGNSSPEFIKNKLVKSDQYSHTFPTFKKPDWSTENYIFWKHAYGALGLPTNLMKAEKSNKHEQIAYDLLETATKFQKQFLS